MTAYPRSVAALGCLLAVLPATAAGYYVEARSLPPMEPVVVRYDTSMPIVYRVHEGGFPSTPDVNQAINAAFQTWEDVACADIEFERGPEVTGMPDPYHWITDPSIYILVYFSADPAIWGMTRRVGFFQFAHDGVGGMTGASIVLNTMDHQWSTTCAAGTLDVQAVVTALIGRSLGITSLDPMSSTYPRYQDQDARKRMLSEDDIDGLEYLYGDASCTPPAPEMICPDEAVDTCPPMAMEMLPDPICMFEGDAGPPPPLDAGGGTDGGGGGTDGGGGGTDGGGGGRDGGGGGGGGDGCGCTTPGGAPLGSGIAFAALVLVALLRRRRL